MISFVLFPQASQPSMNFNISELVYWTIFFQVSRHCKAWWIDDKQIFGVSFICFCSGKYSSLRSKRFRLVWQQEKAEERDFRFWPREKWNESRSLTLVPRSLLLNRTETLATQAKNIEEPR